MSGMTIEPGTYYQTNGGKKVYIEAIVQNPMRDKDEARAIGWIEKDDYLVQWSLAGECFSVAWASDDPKIYDIEGAWSEYRRPTEKDIGQHMEFSNDQINWGKRQLLAFAPNRSWYFGGAWNEKQPSCWKYARVRKDQEFVETFAKYNGQSESEG